ncbi:glycosyltransferase family 2 protein [Aequorivita sp. 609]|uniref:glycosyltransferase family 2 protein n=1 Tax=Aequorivita TaxID=153265 RepID=UPI00161A3DC6|nr:MULTISPECIES: glycosyltransferase family 2 protein [Aequorivita]MBB6681066.1 glycosyltransferase family 2 protein [Aequorivita sp. 609]
MHSQLYIIILNYNSATETVALYNDLKNQSYTNYKAIVVDNNSSIEDRAILEAAIPDSNLRLLSTNDGYASGNKHAIQEAISNQVPFVLLLNPDIRLDYNCVENLVQVLIQNLDVAAVGPRICYRKDPNLIYSDGGLIDMEKGVYTHHLNNNKAKNAVSYNSSLQSIDYVNGSVFLVRTSVFEDIGLMREDFFLYFEETEWCIRAKDNGYRLMTNVDALAYHLSSEKGDMYHYYMTRNRLLLAKLYPAYYQATKDIIWKKLSKKIKKHIKALTLPDSKLIAQLKGYIAGRIKRINP